MGASLPGAGKTLLEPDFQNEAHIDEAAEAISGSRWPGIIDHLLQLPLPGETAQSSIHINYPSTGDRRVDADIRAWVAGIAEAFEEYLVPAPAGQAATLDEEISRFLQDEDMNVPAESDSPGAMFELWGNYRIDRPSRHALSVTFELWNYPAHGEGNLDILTLNYSLLTGQRLALVDIFENPELALKLMSAWARKKLELRLGSSPQMLLAGTEPLVENFSSLTLTPAGVCINFQPYQVAPWGAGIQKVEMPLEELLPASPLLALWNR